MTTVKYTLNSYQLIKPSHTYFITVTINKMTFTSPPLLFRKLLLVAQKRGLTSLTSV